VTRRRFPRSLRVCDAFVPRACHAIRIRQRETAGQREAVRPFAVRVVMARHVGCDTPVVHSAGPCIPPITALDVAALQNALRDFASHLCGVVGTHQNALTHFLYTR
jgi:hypothetical protein